MSLRVENNGVRSPVSGVPPWSRSREEKLPLPRGLEHFLNIKKGARFPPQAPQIAIFEPD